MHISEVEVFKEWLTKTLKPLCEADPCALSKYIVALLKKNKQDHELKSNCYEQLKDFLNEGTRDFVDQMFEVLRKKSYLDGSTTFSTVQEPSSEAQPTDGHQIPSNDRNNDHIPKNFNDETDWNHCQNHDQSDNEAFDASDNKAWDDRRQDDDYHAHASNLGTKTEIKRQRYSRKPCFEFQAMGTCSRIDTCPYKHYRKGVKGSNMMIGSLPLIPTGEIIRNIVKDEVFTQMLEQNKIALRKLPLSTLLHSEVDRKRGYSVKNLTTIPKKAQESKGLVLQNVPSHLGTVQNVNQFFGKFGRVMNVELWYDGDPHSILVEFSTHEEALKAFESPDAILGNRFIRVYFNMGKPKNECEPEKKPPVSNEDLVYVNPEYLEKKEKALKENLVKQEEFEKKREILVAKIDAEVKKIMEKIKNPVPEPDFSREDLIRNLKELLADKDRLLSKNAKGSKRIKFGTNMPNFLDRRPSSLIVNLNKFSDPNGLLEHFGVMGFLTRNMVR